MTKPLFFLLASLVVLSSQLYGQRVAELRLSTTELAFLHLETQVGIGTKKNRFGLLISFRPSTQDSGRVRSGGSGAAGGYGHRYVNRLYTAYTIGLYHKLHFGEEMAFFFETDVFYRNWHFDKKWAEYHDAEKEAHSFKGVRTENVDVYGLKLLLGKAVDIGRAKRRKFQPSLDVYAGLGVRYQEETFETFNGLVGGTFYPYRIDHKHHVWPSPHLGLRFSLLKQRT